MSTTTEGPPTTGDELAARRAAAGGRDLDGEQRDLDDEDDADRDVDADVQQLVLPGVAAGELNMRVGRGRPTSSEFRMRSIGLPLGGQLELDGKVWLLVEADVDDVGVRNHRKGRDVTARVRRHVATPLSVRVLTSQQLAAVNEAGVPADDAT